MSAAVALYNCLHDLLATDPALLAEVRRLQAQADTAAHPQPRSGRQADMTQTGESRGKHLDDG